MSMRASIEKTVEVLREGKHDRIVNNKTLPVISIKRTEASPGLEASSGSSRRWRVRVRRSCARLVQFSDEAAETVVRAELLAVQLEPRRGRDAVALEPLLDGAALVRMAIYLFAFATQGGGEAMDVCRVRPKECL